MIVLLLALTAGIARAEDPSAAPSAPAVLPLRVTGFLGRPGGACEDASAARRGECVDVVDFFPLDRAFGGRVPDAGQRAALRDVGPLYAWVLDDVAARWNKADVEATLKSDGFLALPSVRDTWARGRDEGHGYALPSLDLYLGDGGWVDVGLPPYAERHRGVFFPHVRWAGPGGDDAPTSTAVLRGRFALRLGADGRREDADLMDAHPASAAPFFEQLFPYAAAGGGGNGLADVYPDPTRVPLLAFRQHRVLGPDKPPVLPTEEHLASILVRREPGALRDAAAAHFERFLQVVFVQTAQYAMEDFTTNQIRVLTALSAMGSPFEGKDVVAGRSRDLVAASRFETDNAGEVLEKAGGDQLSLPVGVHLRYEELSGDVVEPWVVRLMRRPDVRSDLLEVVEAHVRDERGERLRDGPALTGLDAAARSAWMDGSVLPGDDRGEVEDLLLRQAFARILERLPADVRAQYESWILADQARLAIVDTFDPTRLATPHEVVKGATEAWTGTLARHGYVAKQVPQGLGAVDPTAVCTRGDGLAALDETTFGTMTLDQLVAAPAGLDAAGVLAAAGGDLPFTHLDDAAQTPVVTSLVRLGDGRALYRLRWKLWRGWHLFWSSAPYDDARDRLLLRVGALCEDTVLAPSDLVPTLVRAGLLAGNLRPSTPERPSEVEAPRRKPKSPFAKPTEDTLGEAEGKVKDAADKVGKQVEAVQKALEAPPIEDLGKLKAPALGEGKFEIVQEPLRDEVQYLVDLVHPPVRRLSDRGLALFVFDATTPGRRLGLGDVVPRTPYARDEERVRRRDLGRAPEADEAWVRTAGWLWYFQPDRERPVEIAPAYAPKDSVSAGDRVPRWSRRGTVAFGLDFGVSAFPWHRSEFVPSGPVPPTYGGLQRGYLQTEGGGVDLGGVLTWWGLNRPRVALDVGAEARLDFRAAGTSIFYDADQQPAGEIIFPWALRFQGGLLVGFRHAPEPLPLHRRGSEGTVWGAPRFDGRSRVTRLQWGLRTGLLFGPGYNGAEASVLLEGWAGFSTRGRRGPQASLAPYRPTFFLGPFARASYGFPVSNANEPGRFLVLQDSWTVYVGLRGHLRVTKPVAPPKGGK